MRDGDLSMNAEFDEMRRMKAESEPPVGFSDLLCRAKTPKEGDTFRKGEQVCTVKAVGDGKVWYDITTGNYEPSHRCDDIEDYVRLVDSTIANGATFQAA